MPHSTMEAIAQLANDGATVIVTNGLPDEVPGLHKHTERRQHPLQITSSLTTAMSNRIAAMDRKKEFWQDYFFVNINYKRFDTAKWPVLPSGLAGPVRLIPQQHSLAK
jgi:hypothetical protein